ncbi:MAG: phosphatidate cytidylyltransferase [Ignavibacteria bacterium]|nr:phosphatidate cytidylyltransferase [Ignavibacteria bacterium]
MSENTKRILTGLIGIPVLVFVILKGGIFFLIFSLITCAIALWEFFTLFDKNNSRPFKIVSILLSLCLIVLYYFDVSNFYLLFLLYLPLLATLEIFRRNQLNPFNLILSVFGFIYVTIPFLLMNSLVNNPIFNFVIYIMILVWVCDTFAYFGGKKFGKHKLSSISPKKTIEGSLIGLIATLVASFVFHFLFPDKIFIYDAIAIGLIAGVFGQIGDLFESLLKRYNDVKDSSHIIPGHGGVLDRFDSLIFVTPIVFVYIVFFKNLF